MWLGANTARLHLLGVVEDLAHYSDRLVEVVRERHGCREDRPPLRGASMTRLAVRNRVPGRYLDEFGQPAG
jgi:hypothetical protein